MTTHSTDVFARLLAAENLAVVHDASAETASFDLDSRVLTLPVWDTMSGHVYDMLVSHEVSHALHTPLDGWKKELEAAGANASLVQHYINVVEDVRIERMIQAKFPGLRPDYKAGRQWMKQHIMGDVLADVANGKAHSIDHVNLFAKGMLDATDLTADEMAMYDRCYACETFDEVVALAKEFINELPEQEQNGDASNGNAQGEGQEGGEGAHGDEQAEGSAQGDDNANANGEGQDQSENAQANSEAKGDGSMESAADAKDDGSNADSNDQRSEAAKKMDAAMKGLINQNASDHEMRNLPVVGKRMNDFLITADEVINSHVGVTITADSIATRNYTNLQAEQKAMVNHMVNLFNQKRSATAHKRARRAKTGVLDTVKMTNYKWSEDIFRQIKVMPEGKNHGFFMLVDWSGSMSDKIIETVKQTIMLAEFCRRVNVPFRVAAFSSTGAEYLRNKERGEYIKGDLEPLYGTCLVEYLSSDLKKADFDKAATVFFDGAIGSTYDKSNYRCSGYKFDSLGSTPLDEGIMIASERMMQMRAAGKCEIMNLIILTDGEASSNMFVSRGWGRQDHGATITDPISGLRFNTKNNWNTVRQSTKMALDVLRARVGQVNIVGIYLASCKRDYTDFWHGQRDLVGAAQYDPKQRLYPVDLDGYEKYFIFMMNSKPVKGLDNVTADDSKAKVRNALIREGKDRKDRKTFLNQLFDMVA
ncbi:MAG: hypothetical protein VX872_00110 [Candidatus Thermoplasmatota archaeon]|nr:hypothetical protein [Candidatus Thermoplasmatota archaeon]